MGGTEKTIANLIKSLKNSYNISLVTLSTGSTRKTEYYKIDKEIPRKTIECKKSLLSYLKAILKIRKLAQNDKNLTILTFLSVPSMITLIATLYLGNKIIVSERTSPNDTEGVAMHWKMLRVITYCLLVKKLIVQSKKIKGEFTYIRDKYKIVIPNAADGIPEFRRNIDEPTQDDVLKLLYIGRYEYQKGVDILLSAMALLKKTNPGLKITLTLAGEGRLKSEYEKLILENKMEKIINIHDKTEKPGQIYTYMDSADFIVIPSRWEGVPNVLIESFAYGLPVIASASASSGFVEEGKNGFLMKEVNEISLKNCILKAVKYQSKHAKMRENSYETSKQFAPAVVYKKWKDEIDN